MSALASLKLTAFALVLLAAGVAGGAAWAIAAPMLLLGVNLCAAIVAQPSFKRHAALLVFHLALAALAILAAAGQLTFLKGRVELTTGEAFGGELLHREQGALHRSRLDDVLFVNAGFEIDYAPHLKRGETRNTVRWRDEAGVERAAVIGDQAPLLIHGYRFYTTPNKGFAALLVWRKDGRAQRGCVHLPSYPAWHNVQAADWTPPGSSERITFRLQMEPMADAERAWRLRLPATHRLEIEAAGVRHGLAPGETLEIGGGALRYEGLTTWMGYSVFYDWTLPWLLAAAIVAALSLGWHFWQRFAARPWQ